MLLNSFNILYGKTFNSTRLVKYFCCFIKLIETAPKAYVVQCKYNCTTLEDVVKYLKSSKFYAITFLCKIKKLFEWKNKYMKMPCLKVHIISY